MNKLSQITAPFCGFANGLIDKIFSNSKNQDEIAQMSNDELINSFVLASHAYVSPNSLYSLAKAKEIIAIKDEIEKRFLADDKAHQELKPYAVAIATVSHELQNNAYSVHKATLHLTHPLYQAQLDNSKLINSFVLASHTYVSSQNTYSLTEGKKIIAFKDEIEKRFRADNQIHQELKPYVDAFSSIPHTLQNNAYSVHKAALHLTKPIYDAANQTPLQRKLEATLG